MIRFAGVLGIFAALIVVGCADPNASQHITFAERDGAPLVGQTVFPPASKRTDGAACAVLFHGGAWVRGRREDMGQIARRLADKGIVTFSVDYRLAPANPWPAPYRDAEEAIRWVRANAQRFRIDPDRVVAVGVSAGGQLALSLSTRGVCPAGSIYGATDMRPGAMPEIEGDVAAATGGTRKGQLDGSPLLQVRPASAPAFLIHGDRDATVPPRHATEFVAAMRRLNRPVVLKMIPNRGHEFDDTTLDTWAAIDEMADWINAQGPSRTAPEAPH